MSEIATACADLIGAAIFHTSASTFIELTWQGFEQENLLVQHHDGFVRLQVHGNHVNEPKGTVSDVQKMYSQLLHAAVVRHFMNKADTLEHESQ